EDLRGPAEAHFVVAAAFEAGHLAFADAGFGVRIAARALLADLHQEFAVLREFQDFRIRSAIAADPDIAFVVDEDAVVAVGPFIAGTRPAPMAQQIAGLIEFENGRRAGAALRRLHLDALLLVGQSRRAAMHD